MSTNGGLDYTIRARDGFTKNIDKFQLRLKNLKRQIQSVKKELNTFASIKLPKLELPKSYAKDIAKAQTTAVQQASKAMATTKTLKSLSRIGDKVKKAVKHVRKFEKENAILAHKQSAQMVKIQRKEKEERLAVADKLIKGIEKEEKLKADAITASKLARTKALKDAEKSRLSKIESIKKQRVKQAEADKKTREAKALADKKALEKREKDFKQFLKNRNASETNRIKKRMGKLKAEAEFKKRALKQHQEASARSRKNITAGTLKANKAINASMERLQKAQARHDVIAQARRERVDSALASRTARFKNGFERLPNAGQKGVPFQKDPLPKNNRLKKLTTSMRTLNRETRESGSNFTTLFRIIATYAVIRGFVQSVQGLVTKLTEFNIKMEQTELGIASLLTAVGEVRDPFGDVVTGSRALRISQEEAKEQTKKLRLEALQTVATFDTLAETFQIALAPGLQAGLDVDQVRKFTVQISQAASAIGLAQNQLAEEVRSILAGTITTKNTRIATSLGITNEDIKKAKEAGTLVEFLNTKFKAFTEAGKEVEKTFGAIATNLKDAISQVVGAGSFQFFVELKDTLSELKKNIADVNEETGEVELNKDAILVVEKLNEGMLKTLRSTREFFKSLTVDQMLVFADAVGTTVQYVIQFAIGLAKAGGYLVSFTLQVFKFLDAMGISAETVGVLVASLTTAFLAFKTLGGIVGMVQSAFYTFSLIAPTLATALGASLAPAVAGIASVFTALLPVIALVSGALLVLSSGFGLVAEAVSDKKGIESISSTFGQITVMISDASRALQLFWKTFTNMNAISLLVKGPTKAFAEVLKLKDDLLKEREDQIASLNGTTQAQENSKKQRQEISKVIEDQIRALKNLGSISSRPVELKFKAEEVKAMNLELRNIDRNLFLIGASKGLKQYASVIQDTSEKIRKVRTETNKALKKQTEDHTVAEGKLAKVSLTVSNFTKDRQRAYKGLLGSTRQLLRMEKERSKAEKDLYILQNDLKAKKDISSSTEVQRMQTTIKEKTDEANSLREDILKVEENAKATFESTFKGSVEELGKFSKKATALIKTQIQSESTVARVVEHKKQINAQSISQLQKLDYLETKRLQNVKRELVLADKAGFAEREIQRTDAMARYNLENNKGLNDLQRSIKLNQLDIELAEKKKALELGRIQRRRQEAKDYLKEHPERKRSDFSLGDPQEEITRVLERVRLMKQEIVESDREELILKDKLLEKEIRLADIKERLANRENKPFETGTIEGLEETLGNIPSLYEQTFNAVTNSINTFASKSSEALASVFDPRSNQFMSLDGWKGFLRNMFADIGQEILKASLQAGIKKILAGIFNIDQSTGKFSGGGILSLFGFGGGGGSSVPSLDSLPSFASGGVVPSSASVGFSPAGIPDSDTVPAWLTPNEFVMRNSAVDKYGSGIMEALNSGRINASALRNLVKGGFSSSVRVRKVHAGLAEGGSASTIRNSSSPASSTGVTPAVVVANNKQMEALLTGGDKAMKAWAVQNASLIKKIVGK